MPATTATISAENTFSEAHAVRSGELFALELTGTWEGTVHLQRRYRNDGSWEDVTDADGTVETWTTNAQVAGIEPVGASYRFGIKTGNYSSGSMIGRFCTR